MDPMSQGTYVCKGSGWYSGTVPSNRNKYPLLRVGVNVEADAGERISWDEALTVWRKSHGNP